MANRSFIVGLVAIAGLTLFTVGLFLVGNRVEAFARHMEFYAEFTNLAGLSKGAKVQVAGMNAGQILDIAIPDSPSSRFRVKLRITKNCMASCAPILLRSSEQKAWLEIRLY
jgi:phospholipid/cholesterol/gamma-HCH transport system substrate-binding protein